jgi:hypothetical protein
VRARTPSFRQAESTPASPPGRPSLIKRRTRSAKSQSGNKGGSGLDVSELGFVTPKGRKLEGVAPDRAVAVTLRDLQAGRDLALDAAEDYLKSLRGRVK